MGCLYSFISISTTQICCYHHPGDEKCLHLAFIYQNISCKLFSTILFLEQSNIIYLKVNQLLTTRLIFHWLNSLFMLADADEGLTCVTICYYLIFMNTIEAVLNKCPCLTMLVILKEVL